MSDILTRLSATIHERRTADPADSYVAGLQDKGLNSILKKVGEEATETLLAARDAVDSNNTDSLIHETADLWFHTLVMLDFLNVPPDRILSELERRFGTSGHAEKASRTDPGS